MPTIETIRRITVQQVSEGGAAVRADLLATAAAQQKVGDAAESAAVVSEVASRRQLSASGAFDRVRASVDGAYRAQQTLERQTRILDRALAQGAIDATTYANTLTLLQARYGSVATAAQRSARDIQSAWRGLGDQGAKVLDNIEASRRLGALGGAAGPASNDNRRLRADQVQNLAFQASDIVSSLGSGSNLSTVAFQQGPQIAQVFGGPGGASIKGAFSQASEAASGLATRIGLVGGAFAVVTAAAVAGVAAFQSYSSTQTALAQNLAGVGRASGATVGQINAIASASAAAGGVSTRQFREMAGAFAATGKIGVDILGDLGKTTKDYAATTGQDLPSATKALAEAFADPAKGADILDKQLAVLNDTTRENIQRLAAQGDRLGAQKALLDAYKTGLTSAAELTSAWGRTTAAVGTTISDIWDKVGGAVDRVVTGGDLETRLATAQKVLETSRARSGGLFGTILPGVAGSDLGKAKDEVARLQAQIQKRDQDSQKAQQNQTSVRLGALIRDQNPVTEQLKAFEDKAENIRNIFRQNWIDPYGQAKAAMDGLVAQGKQLAEDMKAGGASYADAVRAAQFQQRTIGFTPQGQTAAQINESAANKRLDALRNASTNTDQGAFDKQMQSIETERKILIDSLEKTTVLQQNQIGGAFSRMSASVQTQIIAAGNMFGKVPAALIAGIADKESNGNANIGQTKVLGANGLPSTSAYGLGQITRRTAEEAVKRGYLPSTFDRTDPSQGAAGIAGVFQMKLDQAGGDQFKALKNYYGSKSDAANTAYANDVLRRAGQMGDPSTQAQGRDQDANTRALRDQQQQLQNVTANYGKNGLALEASAEATRRYNALLDAGVPANDALATSIKGLATQAATAAQQTRLAQFGSDISFQRDQLGRTSSEQASYSQARSLVGDTSTAGAQFVIAQSQALDTLKQVKDTSQGAFSGIITDLSHGTSVANSFSSALSKIGDKLISFGTDALFSKVFGSLLSGGLGGSSGEGGLLSGIGKLFGFADGGFTGHGAKYEPAGIVHRGEYVIDAATVGRVGRGFFDGLRGYADGGFVTMPEMKTPMASVQGANLNSAPAKAGDTWNVDLRGSPLTEAQVQTAILRATRVNNDERDRTQDVRREQFRRRAG
jgi:phage-related minor tail protein